ncbi:SGNH/GDSL hydrolase family protein [Desulfovibrio caledoniensis]
MKKLINTVLVLASILFTYGLMEIGFRLFMPLMPMSLFNNECRELRTIGQTSKQGTIPTTSYIAILGDSYGAGQGDWFIDERYNPNSRYQATHVVQDKTGRDVISLSRAGSGSYDGLAIYSINTLRYLNNAGFDIPAPEMIVVYFYEGNDISDNLRFMRRHYEQDFDPQRLFDDEYFASFADTMDQKFCQGSLPRLQDKMLVGNLLSRSIEGIIYSATKQRQPLLPGKQYNATLAGKSIWLPDELEVDPSQYTTDELKISTRFFERALRRVAQVWPKARRFMVFIPSPLTTYAYLDADAQKRITASNTLEEMVTEAALANGFIAIDFASKVRKAAQTELLHGPRDWSHFNRKGYELLGTTIASVLNQ